MADPNNSNDPPNRTCHIPNRTWHILYILLMIIAVAFFFFGVIYDRKLDARITTPTFRLQLFTTPPINISDSKIAPHFNFTLEIAEGFKADTVMYNFDSVSLFYDGVFMANTVLAPLVHGSKERSFMEGSFALSPGVVDEWRRHVMLWTRRRGGAVEFLVEVDATVTLGPGTVKEKKKSVWVDCERVRVWFSSSSSRGLLVHAPKGCTIEIRKSPVH